MLLGALYPRRYVLVFARLHSSSKANAARRAGTGENFAAKRLRERGGLGRGNINLSHFPWEIPRSGYIRATPFETPSAGVKPRASKQRRQ